MSVDPANGWSADQYLRFVDQRTRAARDLLAQVPGLAHPAVVDIGCGPGNSTELLLARFPDARVIGLDSSPDMLRQARERLPGVSFEQGDVTTFTPAADVGLLFANAVMQWVPDHLAVMQRLLSSLPEGGMLAVQMPDNLAEPSHRLMREVARRMPFADKFREALALRDLLPPAAAYYDALKPLCGRCDVWHTIYNHVMDGPDAIIEWVKGTGIRPFLAPLDATERDSYLAAYREALAEAYPPHAGGVSLLRFPRFFIVATR